MMIKRKNILITGASSGIGKGIALEFALQGCNLALCARRLENLEELKNQIIEINPNALVFIRALDVTVPDDVFSVFNSFNEDFRNKGEKLDRVIVNAGIAKGASLGKGYAKENMETAITNFCAALSQFEAALEIFRAQNSGHLVAVSSISALRGFSRALNVYAATKAGLASLAEGARVDVMGKPIKVSTLFPGYIQSEMTDSLNKKLPFIVDLEKGSKLLVKAINKEKAKSYIPWWPWGIVRLLMPFFPLSLLRKF